MIYMKAHRYINDPKLSHMSLEQLVEIGIWRTRKNNHYKHQNIEEMDQRHLQNVINTFMNSTNHVVLEALYKELERRTTLANIQKQKIIEIKNKMKNDVTQSEFITIVDESTTKNATDTSTLVGDVGKTSLERIINPYPQCFEKGELIDNRYFIVDVNSENRRGYKYLIKDNTTNDIEEIGQAIFLKRIGRPRAENTAKPKKNRSNKVSTRKYIKPNGTHLVQRYNEGDLVGKYTILSSRRAVKGYGGIVYKVKNTKTSEIKSIKQSSMTGLHVPAPKTINQFLQDDTSIDKFPAAVIAPKVKHTKSKKSTKKTFTQRLKDAWVALTE